MHHELADISGVKNDSQHISARERSRGQKQGNKIVSKGLVQCKLTVGEPGDRYEREADTVADKVMRMPEQSFVHRKCAQCEEEEKIQLKPLDKIIQRKLLPTESVISLSPGHQETNQSIDETQGIRIRFKDKEGAIQFMFYSINMESNTGNEFADETIKSLNKLYLVSPTAKEIIIQAMNLGNITTIKFTSLDEMREYDPWANDKKGHVTGDISWNPYIADVYSIPDPESGTKVQAPAITLIHELIHFVQHGKRLNDIINKVEGAEKDLQDYLWEKGKYASLEHEEDDVKIESQIARELHMGTRPNYDEAGKKTITENSVSVTEVTDRESKNKKLEELKTQEKKGSGQLPVQKKEDQNAQPGRNPGVTKHVSSDIEEGINSTNGRGKNIDSPVLSFMQRHFGVGFSDVKVHTDGEAVQMSRELNAKAFTTGNDIYFNEGQYQPGSDSGKKLLAHELTHVLQQGGTGRRVQRTITGTTENESEGPGPAERDMCEGWESDLESLTIDAARYHFRTEHGEEIHVATTDCVSGTSQKIKTCYLTLEDGRRVDVMYNPERNIINVRHTESGILKFCRYQYACSYSGSVTYTKIDCNE